jgi:glycosyltransferase involved in cell wall biosynthesis
MITADHLNSDGEVPLRVLVFTPTLNDFSKLPELAAAVRSLKGDYTFLVIDDGSAKAINHVALGEDVLYVRLPANFGVGTCTNVAFDHAIAHAYDAVVRIDADGQHPVEKIPEILAPILKDTSDVVVAQRSNRNDTPGPRALLARFVRGYLAFVARLVTRGRVPADVTSGFFAFSKAAINVLRTYHFERFSEPQTYILASRRNLRIGEVPIVQLPRDQGKSTVTIGQAIRLVYRFNMFVLAELLQKSRAR